MEIKQWVQNFLCRIKNFGEDRFEIKINQVGMALFRNGLLKKEMPWEEVIEIIAYRKDLLTHAPVCLSFYGEHDLKQIEVDEFMSGFDRASTEICKRFGCNIEWFEKVDSGDAFSENRLVIWRRAPTVPPVSG